MRIIAGEFRGRTIKAPKGDGTRPTTDRVRESLMSAVHSACGGFEDAVVLDAVAGSGALGLEALSRGASCARFFERDGAAERVLEGNVRALGLDARRARVSRGDVLFDIVPDALDDMEGGDGNVYMQEDGVLLSVSASSGTQAAKDAVLATYCPKDAMRLVCSVDEQDIADIQVGDAMTVTLDAYEDKPLRGVVTKIASASGNGDSSYDVTLELEENDLMRIGMSASAEK